MTALRFVEHLREVVGEVDVVLSDIWGVVHNGLESFPEACAALHAFRERGGTVILITNAPRPADSVQRQLRKLDVPDESYDAIVSSGDLTRHFVAAHPGQKIFWLGPERDGSIHRGLALGDSGRTDLAGAQGFGINCLFVTRGIHAGDFEGIDQLDPASVKELFGHPPLALMRELRW